MDQTLSTPRNMEQWAMEKAKNRGISSQEIPRAKLNLPWMSSARARIFGSKKNETKLPP